MCAQVDGGKADQLDVGWREGQTGTSYFLTALRRQILILILIPILAGGLALAYAVTIEPLYTASAEIGVRVNSEEISAETSLLSTHIELIQSDSMTSAVIERIGLEPADEARPGALRQKISTIRSWLNLSPVDGVADFNPASALIRSVVSGIDVQRVGDASLIMINYTSSSPNLSAEVANTYATIYVDQRSLQVDQSNQNRRILLEQRAEEAKQKALNAKQDSEDILERNDFVLVNSSDLGRRIADFRERLSAVSAEAAAIDARLERIPSMDADGAFEDAAVLTNETAQLYADLKAALNLRERLNAQLGVPENNYYQLEESVTNLRSRLVQAVSRYREDLRAEQAVVAARRADILAERERVTAFGQSEAWTELVNAERDASIYDAIYQSYLQDLENLYRQPRNAPVYSVSNALEPMTPSFPDYKVILAFGVTIGVVLAGGIALLREWQRRPS